MLLGFSLSPVPVVVVAVLVTAYVLGVRRLARRGRRWPRARTLAFLAGCGVVLVAMVSGVAEYDQSTFSVHVVQHLLLGMLGPLLLALGAPVTLVLQAGSRTTQTRLRPILLHSPPVKVLTNPLVAWLLFSGSLFVLHLHLHLLRATAELPRPRRRPPAFSRRRHALLLARRRGSTPACGGCTTAPACSYVMLALPVHAFLGIALLSGQTPLFEVHTLADQHAGGGILWAVGDLLTLATVGVVLTQWMSHEERESALEDRLLDERVPAGSSRSGRRRRLPTGDGVENAQAAGPAGGEDACQQPRPCGQRHQGRQLPDGGRPVR